MAAVPHSWAKCVPDARMGTTSGAATALSARTTGRLRSLYRSHVDLGARLFSCVCLDMRLDMRLNMCLDMCLNMYLDLYLDLRLDTCLNMCLDICLDLYLYS